MRTQTKKGNVVVFALVGIVVLALAAMVTFVFVKNRQLQPASQDYTQNLSPTEAAQEGEGTQPEPTFDETNDADIKNVDSMFNQIDSGNFDDSELSNPTLGL